MSKTNKKRNTVVTVIIILVVVLVLLGVFMLVHKLRGNSSMNDKFYLEVDGQTVASNVTMAILNKEIKVHNVGVTSGKQDFTYKIVRNGSADAFTFTLDEQKHTFIEVKDYTKGFDVEQTEAGLIVKSANMETILHRVYGDGKLELPELPIGVCYFTLVVNSKDGSDSISIDFAINYVVTGIELDHTHLEF